MTIDKQRLRDLAEKATPGPWTVESEWTGEHSGADVVYGRTRQVVCQCDEHDGGYGGGQRNVEYIAAADPQTVLVLLDELDEARADCEAAEQRMIGMLDGTFAVGDGTAQREIERLRERILNGPTEPHDLAERIRAELKRQLAAMTAARDRLACMAATYLGDCEGEDPSAYEYDRIKREIAELRAIGGES